MARPLRPSPLDPRWRLSSITQRKNASNTPPQGQKRYDPANLKGSILTRIDTPIPGTTANLVGSYILRTPKGKASVPSDPTPLRYAKLVFGGLFFAFICLLLAFLLVLLIGGCCILAPHFFDFLNQCFLNECAWIRGLLRLLHRWHMS